MKLEVRIFTILFILVSTLMSCLRKDKYSPVILKRYYWVKSIAIQGLDTINTTEEELGYNYLLSITKFTGDYIQLGFGSGRYGSVSSNTECTIESIDGASLDLNDCLSNELCFGMECGLEVCIEPWNKDTVRITGFVFPNNTLTDSCNYTHLFVYKQEEYDY